MRDPLKETRDQLEREADVSIYRLLKPKVLPAIGAWAFCLFMVFNSLSELLCVLRISPTIAAYLGCVLCFAAGYYVGACDASKIASRIYAAHMSSSDAQAC